MIAPTTTARPTPVTTRLLTEVQGGIKPAGKAGSAGKKGVSSSASAGAGKSKAKPPPVQIIEEEDDDEEEDEEDDDEEWEDNEEEEEYDEEEEEYESPRAGRGGKRQQNDWHYADRRRRLAARRGSSYGMAGLFKGAAKLTGNSVSKVAGLFQPNKYVGLREVVGVWKVKQKVSERPGDPLERCEATVEIRKDGSVVTFFDGKELVSEFLFKERQWPRSCIIEFEARAFQGPYDREPQLKFYKGYVRRSLMNPQQVRLEGKIYEVKGTFFWRQKRQVGKFRAVKR